MRRPRLRRQPARGVVLIVSLVVLVLLTLAVMALLRSAATATALSGNLALQRAAVQATDRGIETAVAWLRDNQGQASSSSAAACSAGSTVLACDQASHGYLATRSDPASGQTWADWWTHLATSATPVSLAADASGHSVAYLIQRLCSATGDAASGSCAVPPGATECGQSHAAGATSTGCTAQVYYRITVRSSGPRNTVSYVQSLVAL